MLASKKIKLKNFCAYTIYKNFIIFLTIFLFKPH